MSQNLSLDRQGSDVEVLDIDAVFLLIGRSYCIVMFVSLFININPQSTTFFQLIALKQFYRLKKNSAMRCSCPTM